MCVCPVIGRALLDRGICGNSPNSVPLAVIRDATKSIAHQYRAIGPPPSTAHGALPPLDLLRPDEYSPLGLHGPRLFYYRGTAVILGVLVMSTANLQHTGNPLLKAHIPGWEGISKRTAAVKKYSWAIPTDEAISAIVACGPIIEIGAGKGYWAGLVAKAHGDIVATDKFNPPDNDFTDKRRGYHKIEQLSALDAVRQYHNRALLTIWPSYRESWTSEALAEYLNIGGKTVIYVGEDSGGCTGDERFHELLDELAIVRTIGLPQWAGIHDYMEIREVGK